MVKKKSALRPVLLWAGAIFAVMGNTAIELGYANGAVATVVGIVVALIGCYLWTPVTKIEHGVLHCWD